MLVEGESNIGSPFGIYTSPLKPSLDVKLSCHKCSSFYRQLQHHQQGMQYFISAHATYRFLAHTGHTLSPNLMRGFSQLTVFSAEVSALIQNDINQVFLRYFACAALYFPAFHVNVLAQKSGTHCCVMLSKSISTSSSPASSAATCLQLIIQDMQNSLLLTCHELKFVTHVHRFCHFAQRWSQSA